MMKWQAECKEVWLCSDSDWAGDRRTRKSTSGGCIWRGAHWIKAWCRGQSAISLSSGEAELYAAVQCASEGMGVKTLLRELGHEVSLSMGVDASAAVGLMQRDGLGRTKHIDTQSLWIQSAVRNKEVKIMKIDTDLNPADLMTKPLKAEAIKKFMAMMGFHFP